MELRDTAGLYTTLVTPRGPRFLYFGVPLGALVLARAGMPPAPAALAPLDLPGRRRLRRILGPRTLLLGSPRLTSSAVQAALVSVRPEASLVFYWPRRIPEALLRLAPAWGVHPSLLPAWRGPDPTYWAIRSGARETGVSLHALEGAYDTGAVAARATVPIHDADDAWTLARRLDRPGLRLLLYAAARLGAGLPLVADPQDPRLATAAPFPTDADLALDWRLPAAELVRHVRAAAPEPGAHGLVADRAFLVRRARVARARLPAGLRPAEAIATAEGWHVRCGEGALTLEEVSDEEGRPLEVATLFEAPGGG